MREIKFRAWHEGSKTMMFPDTIQFRAWKDSKGEVLEPWIGYGEGDVTGTCPLDQVVLMQFTGLKDKNGKEIYEGDVAKLPNGEFQRVIWQNTLGCWQHEALDYSRWGQLDEMFAQRIEIIGNLYETPELLTPNHKENV